jgi:His/Glu/Gln/Arg/opine family amino acid ABC transporter permease subunit
MGPIVDNLPYMLGGLKMTALLSVGALAGSAVLGILFGLGRLSKNKPIHYVSVVFIEVGRAIPAMLLVLSTYFIVVEGGINISPVVAGIVALSIDSGAYTAEIVRSGILSVSTGQLEAASSSGLTYVQSMRLVVLPQALRSMVPALASEGTKVIKNTSLVAIIGGSEFFNRVNIVNSRLLVYPFLLFGFAAVVYFLINFAFSLACSRFQWRRDV